MKDEIASEIRVTAAVAWLAPLGVGTTAAPEAAEAVGDGEAVAGVTGAGVMVADARACGVPTPGSLDTGMCAQSGRVTIAQPSSAVATKSTDDALASARSLRAQSQLS